MRNIIAVTMLMLNNSTSWNLIEFIFIYKWVISNLISLFELNWKPFMVFLCQEVGFKRPKCSSVCKIVETTTLHEIIGYSGSGNDAGTCVYYVKESLERGQDQTVFGYFQYYRQPMMSTLHITSLL